MDKQAELRQWLEIADNDLAYAEFASKNMWPACSVWNYLFSLSTSSRKISQAVSCNE